MRLVAAVPAKAVAALAYANLYETLKQIMANHHHEDGNQTEIEKNRTSIVNSVRAFSQLGAGHGLSCALLLTYDLPRKEANFLAYSSDTNFLKPQTRLRKGNGSRRRQGERT